MITHEGKEYFSYSDYSDYTLRSGQVFKVVDLRKKMRNTFTVWSNEQLNRLFEDGVIDDEHFRVMLGKSAEMGYSSSIADRKEAKARAKQKLDEMLEEFEV